MMRQSANGNQIWLAWRIVNEQTNSLTPSLACPVRTLKGASMIQEWTGLRNNMERTKGFELTQPPRVVVNE